MSFASYISVISCYVCKFMLHISCLILDMTVFPVKWYCPVVVSVSDQLLVTGVILSSVFVFIYVNLLLCDCGCWHQMWRLMYVVMLKSGLILPLLSAGQDTVPRCCWVFVLYIPHLMNSQWILRCGQCWRIDSYRATGQDVILYWFRCYLCYLIH